MTNEPLRCSLPDPIPWRALAGPFAQADDALAWLDERLARSPVCEGWIARTHLTEACAALWLDGELVHSQRVIDGKSAAPRPRDPLVYDLDWKQDERLQAWRAVRDQTRNLPPLLAGAFLWEAWQNIEPLQHRPWLGAPLVAALLREQKKTKAHLLCLNAGLRLVSRERRRAENRAARLIAWAEAVAAAAEAGMKDHDRWLLARRQLERKLVGRRSTSHLAALIDLVLAHPIANVGLIAKQLSVTPRAAQNLVAELGLREATGRGRYRAWGIL
jgi:Protein of unknown function (DUF1612)/HTH DNA binding domain